MPVAPGTGIGVVLLLHWLVLPLLAVWFVRRQLAHDPERLAQETVG